MVKRSENVSEIRMSSVTSIFRMITVFSLIIIISMLNIHLTVSQVSFEVEEDGIYDGTSTRSSLPTKQSSGCFGLSTRIPGIGGAYAIVATDNIGGVFVAYQSHWTENGSDYVHVYFAYSHDYGRSWSESYRVDDNGGVLVHCDSPTIAVDQNTGHVYVAWKDNRTGVAKVYIDKSVDRGGSFGTDILVYDWSYDRVPTGIYSLYTVNLEIQEDGGIYAAWVAYYSDTYTNCDIFFSQSDDGGQTFNTPTSVNPREIEARHTKPWIAIDGDNIIYVVYSKINSTSSNVYMVRSLDRGSSFETPVKVNDDSTNRYKGGKNVVVSPDGKIHVIWTDGRAGDGIQYLDIYFATSLDGGISFGPNVRVNDDPVVSSPPDGWGKTCQGTPSIVTDSATRVHIVWEDFRNYVDITTYCRDIYYSTSKDGAQFSKNLQVNNVHPESVSVSCADPNIAIDSHDNLYIVYSDATAGDQMHHIYFTFTPSQEWEWTKFHHDSENTGFSPSTAPKMNITHWNYSAKGAIESSPAIANSMVFFGASNEVYALNRTTGELIWNFTADEAIKSSPAVVDGLVFVGSDDQNIYVLNGTNGNIIWNFTADDAIVSSPNIAEGLVFIGSDDFNLYALNQTNGQLVWNFTTTSQVKQSPAVAAGLVFFGSDDQMYALNLTTGSVFWQQTHSVGSSPAAIEGFVFFGSNTSMVSLNWTNGHLIWETSTGGVVDSSPAIAYGMVFFGCSNSTIYGLNQTDGSLVWQYTTNDAVHSSPAIADGLLFVGSNDGYMYALNWTNGHLIWKYTTGGEVHSSPAIVNSQVFFGSFNGNLYAVGDLYDLAITDITPSKTVVGQNFSLKLDITAANQGNYTESLRITIFANAIEIGSRNLLVLGRDSVSFSFTWNTANASLGNYTIMAVVESLPIESNVEDNTLVAGDVVCVTIPGDVDGNYYVNIFDIVRIAGTYGSTEPDPLYNATYDIDDDGDIDIYDVVIAAGHYGESWA